jgi:hypothetical protein
LLFLGIERSGSAAEFVFRPDFQVCRTFTADPFPGSRLHQEGVCDERRSMNSSPSKPTPKPGLVSVVSALPAAPPAQPGACVYGDSTPFPYEGNFIETIRHAIDCGVSLLSAQQTLDAANARIAEVDRAKHLEKLRLQAMSGTVKRTLAAEMAPSAERLVRAGSRILDASRAAIEAEVAALEIGAAEEIARARQIAADARTVVQRALETFLLHHDLPGTETGLRLSAEESRYRAQAQVGTPFGVEGGFDLEIPLAHEWGRPVRVADLSAGTEVHVPTESGLFFKKVAVQPVKLDRLFVTALYIGSARGTITLRRQPTGGAGYKVDFDATGDRTRVLMVRLGEDGTETVDPVQDLTGEDAVHLLRLWQRVLASTEELGRRRHAMTGAAYEGVQIKSFDEPKLVAARIVRLLAPIVREIAQRSGAPGELVLRRDVRAGRRDEIYITKAELHEKVLALPPALRSVFDPFELDSPRSPRAPAPSVPARMEVQEAEFEEVSGSALVVAMA